MQKIEIFIDELGGTMLTKFDMDIDNETCIADEFIIVKIKHVND